jgi:hypothetical protein
VVSTTGSGISLRNTRLGSFAFNATATQIIKRGTDSGLGGGFYNNAGLLLRSALEGFILDRVELQAVRRILDRRLHPPLV